MRHAFALEFRDHGAAEKSGTSGNNDAALCDRKTHVSFGMNALPTFLAQPKWELSLFRKFEMEALEKIMQQLGIEFLPVEDRVGLVKPRVIFMIINEASYTLQEGTASIEDIDQAMKLGTNYPFGPFEWCDKLGVKNVYEILQALYEDTHEERYKICPLLKTKYLRREKFIHA